MGEAVVSRFTTAQLARILDLPPSEIRRWVRSGLLRRARGEGRSASFDFRDVATSRAVAALTRAASARGNSSGRCARSADGCRMRTTWLPHLEAAGDGGGVRVRLRSGEAAEPSGQLLLDFAAEVDGARPAEERIVELRPQSGAEALPDPDGAEAWFDAGVHADEAGAHEQAVDAYAQAIERGADSAEVYYNLGNARYALGRAAEAASSYLRAVEREPDYVAAWNNLGNALIDTGRAAEAVDAYRRALAVDPHYADAHSNLAEACVQLGRTQEAHQHWQAYLRAESAQHLGRAGPPEAALAADAAGAGHPLLNAAGGELRRQSETPAVPRVSWKATAPLRSCAGV